MWQLRRDSFSSFISTFGRKVRFPPNILRKNWGEPWPRYILFHCSIADIFHQEVKGLCHPYILTETVVETSNSLSVRLYGNDKKLPSLVPGACYALNDVEMTISPPYAAWIGNLTRVSLLNMDNVKPG